MIEAHGTGEHSASLPSAIYPKKSSSPFAGLTICLVNRSRSMRRRTKMDMYTKVATIAGATNITLHFLQTNADLVAAHHKNAAII
jgi:hypothetical protein